MAQTVENLPAMKTLGQEDPLEEDVAAHSSILAWEIPGTEEPGGLRPWCHRVGHNRATSTHCPVMQGNELFISRGVRMRSQFYLVGKWK